MLTKRKIALLLLAPAYAILLGHGLLAHHHHSHEEKVEIHGSLLKMHDGCTGGLAHFFAHFCHSADAFTCTAIEQGTPMVQAAAAVSPLGKAVLGTLSTGVAVPRTTGPVRPDWPLFFSPKAPPAGLRGPPIL